MIIFINSIIHKFLSFLIKKYQLKYLEIIFLNIDLINKSRKLKYMFLGKAINANIRDIDKKFDAAERLFAQLY